MSVKKATILSLNYKDAFNQLTEKEKLYAYYMNEACWVGQPITSFQVSYESPILFVILQSFFTSIKPIKELKKHILEKSNGKVNEEQYEQFLQFCGKIYSNSGNYTSFGKKKIFPEIPKEILDEIFKTSSVYETEIKQLWDEISELIYNDSPNYITSNLEEKGGKNSYYLNGIREEQIHKIDKILQEKNIDPLNTRLYSINPIKTVVLISSIDEKIEKLTENIILYYGEFNKFIKLINENLTLAKKYCANETEEKMLDAYIESFKTGSIEKHKDSQRYWVKDKLPIVETNIGWIETYIDPLGVRAYYEGWVAVTDKDKSKKFNDLVSNAEKFLKQFPWSLDFEKDKFLSPDFIALDIISFSSDGCPIGINIPNYSDVQETDGFKNISLSNAYPTYKAENMQFSTDDDIKIMERLGKDSMVMMVGCHELLGHGSGKLLRKDNKNVFNFKNDLINPLTNNKIDKFYIDNETFESKFKSLGRSMEECRADLVALFFVFEKDIHKIFSVKDEDYENLIYCMFLGHARKGVVGLPIFNPDNKKWGQAHTQGAFVFTNFILKNQNKDNPIFTIKLSDDEKDFKILLNKDNMMKFGRDLVSKILLNLHIWKCTGDCESTEKFYDEYSHVDDFMLKIRKICVDNEKPRRFELYHNLKLSDDGKNVSVVEYPETVEGIIESNVDRFGTKLNQDIIEQWRRYDTKFFN